MLDMRWCDREKGGGKPGVSSMLDVGWCDKAEGTRAVAGGGDILNAQHQVMWQRGGWWRTREGVYDGRCQMMWQNGGCEGSCRLGEAFSTLNINWHGWGEGRSKPGEEARCRVTWQSSEWGQWEVKMASMLFEKHWGNPAHIFWGRGIGDGGGRWR